MVELLENLKLSSSKWIKTKGKEFETFYWQIGYGAFSINQIEVEMVKQYFLNQKKYHEI